MCAENEELLKRQKATFLKILRLPLAKRRELVRLQRLRRGLYAPIRYGRANLDGQNGDSLPALEEWFGKDASNDKKFRTKPLFYPPCPPCTVLIADGDPPAPYG